MHSVSEKGADISSFSLLPYVHSVSWYLSSIPPVVSGIMHVTYCTQLLILVKSKVKSISDYNSDDG